MAAPSTRRTAPPRGGGRSLVSDERGVIAAWFAVLCMFVFFGFSFFVINLSKTHEHRRHLQVQVDDGALAAGTFFTGCFQTPAEANANIAREAHRFSGDPTYPTNYYAGDPSYPAPYNTTTYPGPFNYQVEYKLADQVNHVRIGLNKPTFPPYAAPVTDFDPAYDLRPDLDGIQNLPCDASILDVKATDSSIPTPFGGVVPANTTTEVKARARVEIRKVVALNGMLPWAVPEVNPKCVAVLFVNDNGSDPTTPISTQKLNLLDANGSPVGGCGAALPLLIPTRTLNGEAQALWQGLATTTVGSGTGMIVLTSLDANPDLTGTVPQICSRTGVRCYAGSSAKSGLDFIHGWPQQNTGSTRERPPVPYTVTLYDATLVPLGGTGCNDQSAPYFWLMSDADSCTFRLDVTIDWGALGGRADKKLLCGSGCVMTKNSSGCSGHSSPSGECWTSNAITVNALSGRNQIDLTWCIDGNNSCGGNPTAAGGFTNVQHAYVANDPSGPVDYVAIRPTNGVGFANSRQTGSQTLSVEVGLQPPLHVTSNGEPPILLRFASKSGSLNQALDCDKSPRNLADEVATGCMTYYKVNKRNGACDPPWTNSTLPPATFVPPSGNLADSPDCVAAKTGDVTAMAQGLHARWENPPPPAVACPPNNWPKSGGPLPDSNDPRWVILVVTNFAAFSGSGAEVVPVTKFAGFYVTGWFQGSGGSLPDGCPTNDPPPNGASPTSKSVKGDVWGYFVTDVPNLPGALASDELCAFNEVGLCVPVLTQ